MKSCTVERQVSQGNVALNLRWCEGIYYSIFCSLCPNMKVKQLLKLVQWCT